LWADLYHVAGRHDRIQVLAAELRERLIIVCGDSAQQVRFIHSRGWHHSCPSRYRTFPMNEEYDDRAAG
jgi:hypothetical protein